MNFINVELLGPTQDKPSQLQVLNFSI